MRIANFEQKAQLDFNEQIDCVIELQSFDCKKASSLSEKTICGSDELKVLDSKLAEVYKEKLAKSEGAQILRNEQREWLKKSGSCGGDAACLKTAYDSRLNILRNANVIPAVLSKPVVELKAKDANKILSSQTLARPKLR